MPLEVVWTDKAKKGLKALDKPVAARIFGKVEELGGSETVFLEKVTGHDFYKFRVGNYRVLIDKLPATKKLFILKVGHRKNVYQNL